MFKGSNLTARGETYALGLYRRIENSPYEWETTPYFYFKGRPASQIEVRTYRVMQGVNSNSDSVFIYATNLPDFVKPKDKVLFLGKQWTVESIGYYYEQNQIINAGIMSDEYLIARCPKGISLQ